MHPDLTLSKELLYDPLNFRLTEFKEEVESCEYGACTFFLGKMSVKFRSAKITPTKTGAFVTLWKRNPLGITCPHEQSDPFELYIISVRKDKSFGQFVFPKSILLAKGILSQANKDGKRGFRIYAAWDLAENNQAAKTQRWQSEFFMDLSNGNDLDSARMKRLCSDV